MLVTCHWPHCEDTEQDVETSKNNVQTSSEDTNTQTKSAHQAYYPHYFETTTLSQKIQDIT